MPRTQKTDIAVAQHPCKHRAVLALRFEIWAKANTPWSARRRSDGGRRQLVRASGLYRTASKGPAGQPIS